MRNRLFPAGKREKEKEIFAQLWISPVSPENQNSLVMGEGQSSTKGGKKGGYTSLVTYSHFKNPERERKGEKKPFLFGCRRNFITPRVDLRAFGEGGEPISTTFIRKGGHTPKLEGMGRRVPLFQEEKP